MDPEFWHERWRTGDIGFHRPEAHDLLTRHWPGLDLDPDAKVLVPLCGKSHDMAWLAARGHRIVGVELSQIAIDEFFAHEGLAPESEQRGSFNVKRAGPYELWCGDIFALPAEAVDSIAGVYDRASLVAFPLAEQPRFANALAALTPRGGKMLLIGLEHDPAEMKGPPFPASRERIAEMLGGDFGVTLIEERDALAVNPGLRKRGLTRLVETAFRLTRR